MPVAHRSWTTSSSVLSQTEAALNSRPPGGAGIATYGSALGLYEVAKVSPNECRCKADARICVSGSRVERAEAKAKTSSAEATTAS